MSEEFGTNLPPTSSSTSPDDGVREVKLRLPQDFTGDRTKVVQFTLEVGDYLDANERMYNTNRKKIAFINSFLTGGPALQWRIEKVKEVKETGEWPKAEDYLAEIVETFRPIQSAAIARRKLATIVQGDVDVDKYITAFLMLKGDANVKDEEILCTWFVDGLNEDIARNIDTMSPRPTTLKEYMNAAAHFEYTLGRIKKAVSSTKAKNVIADEKEGTRGTQIATIEINRMTAQEREEHMKKGLCFRCHRPGHRSSDHKGGNIPSTPERSFIPRQYPKMKNLSGRDAYLQIKAMTADLDPNEKEKMMDIMVETGF
jgi:hypothetical protein